MGTTFSRHPSVSLRRNEKERLLFIAAATLACSLLVIMLVILNYRGDAVASQVNTNTTPAAPAPMGTVTLYVPEREVKAGAKLSDIAFKEVYWPRNQVPANAVLDLSEIKNQYARLDMAQGMPIQRDVLTAVPLSETLKVTKGNRAVSIEVDASGSVEGYARPGSIVDVILTYFEGGNLTSKVIVESARVLSLNGDSLVDRRRPGSTATPGKTITLDVSPQNALKIRTASQLGKLSLNLRDPDDLKGSQQTSWDAQDFSDQRVDKKSGTCTRGTIRSNGEEYLLNCDGTKVRVDNPQEP